MVTLRGMEHLGRCYKNLKNKLFKSLKSLDLERVVTYGMDNRYAKIEHSIECYADDDIKKLIDDVVEYFSSQERITTKLVNAYVCDVYCDSYQMEVYMLILEFVKSAFKNKFYTGKNLTVKQFVEAKYKNTNWNDYQAGDVLLDSIESVTYEILMEFANEYELYLSLDVDIDTFLNNADIRTTNTEIHNQHKSNVN